MGGYLDDGDDDNEYIDDDDIDGIAERSSRWDTADGQQQ